MRWGAEEVSYAFSLGIGLVESKRQKEKKWLKALWEWKERIRACPDVWVI